ncbi:MAG: peptidoglycan LD-endopeptidase LytH [Sphingomonadales bacterium]|jgi:murein DD-endopeptidase MepM/ murein hydrolase activator NlpD|nr:peptidoglycan LD-endopeptidase LytH [Sphingomonadales bacterium]
MRRLTLLTIVVIAAVMSFLLAGLFLFATNGDATRKDDGRAPTPAEISAALGANREEEAYVSPAGLTMPVEGIAPSRIVDTYANARGGGARIHNALDIMAPRGSLVVAAAEGTVERLHYSAGGGGITAYVRSPDGGWMYYYAHLDSYAPGLAVGQRLERGDPIGRVGSSGNANAAWPHLHFAVHRMSASDRWYQGAPVNPYPLLAASRARR